MRKFVELKKSELLALYDSIRSFKDKYNKNFTYALSYTKKIIANEAEALIEAMVPSDSYLEYDKERRILLEKYGDIDGEGKLIINSNNGAVKIKDGFVDECQVAIADLNQKYDAVLVQRELDYANFEKVLNSTISIDVETVEWDYVPDTIDQSLMDALLPIITRG